MFYTYILKSRKTGLYYIGYTHDIQKRLDLHNKNKPEFTKDKGPWDVYHIEAYETASQAIRRERKIKKWKSRKAIERLKFCSKIEDPDSAFC